MRERVGRGAPMSQEVLVYLPLGARAEGNGNRADGSGLRRRSLILCQVSQLMAVLCHAFCLRQSMPGRSSALSSAGRVVQSLILVCLPSFLPVRRRLEWLKRLRKRSGSPTPWDPSSSHRHSASRCVEPNPARSEAALPDVLRAAPVRRPPRLRQRRFPAGAKLPTRRSIPTPWPKALRDWG